MIGVTPGISGVLLSGRFEAPFALYQAKTCRMATSGSTRLAAPGGLMSAPPYRNWRVSGLPAADEASAMELATAVTYFETLPVTDHRPSPSGSTTTPRRGLHASSVITVRPAWSAPLFLS